MMQLTLNLTIGRVRAGEGAAPCSEDALGQSAFTGTNGTQLVTHDARWTLISGDFDLASNTLAPDGVGEHAAYWNDVVFSADQWAEAVLVAVSNGLRDIGLSVRGDTGGAVSYYAFYANSTAYTFFKMVAGVKSALDTIVEVPAPADVLRLEVEGTTVRAFVNAVEVASVTDVSLASGAPGVSGQGDSTANRIDSWQAGNLCP